MRTTQERTACIVEFARHLYLQGRCNSVNAILEDCDAGEFYIYKNEWHLWKAAWKASATFIEECAE